MINQTYHVVVVLFLTLTHLLPLPVALSHFTRRIAALIDAKAVGEYRGYGESNPSAQRFFPAACAPSF
jgi:hypothetical protein